MAVGPAPAGEAAPNFLNDARFKAIVTTNIVLLCVASVTIILRLYVRIIILKHMGWDDGESGPLLAIPTTLRRCINT